MLRQMIGLVGTVLLSLTSFAHANPCQLGIKEPAMPWLPPIFKVRFLVGGAMLIAILMASSVGLCASPPVATDDAFTVTGTPEGVTCRLLCLFPNGPNVLDNDTDADGDPLTAILVSGASHGRLCLFASGEADYCPDPNFSGTDQFTYQASDGALTSNIATVTIAVTAVNNAPVANDDTYITIEDVSLVATAPGVLANDTDGDTFTAIWVGGPAHGTLLLSSDGSFTYAPNPNFSGIDQFTYQASDGALTSNIATVTITVTAANDPPVATPDAYTTMEDSALNVGALGVLANDTDVDGDPLTAVLVSGPAHGTLTLNPDGSFTYTPAHNFSGTDQFAYRAIDAEGVFASAQVTITVTAVNNAPVATDDAYITTEDVSLAVKAPGVLGNDTDTDGDTLTAALVSGPAHGTLTLNANGSFTYTPTSNFSGTDQVTYQASDGALTSNIATVSIAVSAVNDPPVALADGPFLGNAGRSVQMDASASSDSEGAALTFRWNFGDGSTLVTPQAPIEHTYASGGTFPVTLIVNDGQLDSAPFTTQASIGITGGGQQDEVDEFLTYVSPTKKSTDLPAGTTSFSVVIIYGPTILSSTFQASLNGEPFGGFDPRAGTSETVTIPLASGRNVLALQVVGVRADGRQATDRDQPTFNIP